MWQWNSIFCFYQSAFFTQGIYIYIDELTNDDELTITHTIWNGGKRTVQCCVPQLYTQSYDCVYNCGTLVYCGMSSSYRCTGDCWFRFSLRYFVCFCMFFLPRASLFVLWFLFVFLMYFLFCFQFSVSVPVQVIAWKDSSPKWSVMCRAGRKTTHSL